MGEREMSQNKSLQSKMPLAMGLAFVAFTNTKPTITEAFPTVFTEKRNRLCPISMRSVT